jgi:hypothetical protein
MTFCGKSLIGFRPFCNWKSETQKTFARKVGAVVAESALQKAVAADKKERVDRILAINKRHLQMN